MSYSGLSLSTALVLRFFVGRGFSFRGWTGAPRPATVPLRSMRPRCWVLLSWSPVSRLSPAVHDRDDKDVISLE